MNSYNALWVGSISPNLKSKWYNWMRYTRRLELKQITILIATN